MWGTAGDSGGVIKHAKIFLFLFVLVLATAARVGTVSYGAGISTLLCFSTAVNNIDSPALLFVKLVRSVGGISECRRPSLVALQNLMDSQESLPLFFAIAYAGLPAIVVQFAMAAAR